jgi:hydroxyethylthiazole kinase-like uncharacterized protein yjeF
MEASVKKIVTVEQMRAIEQEADASGLTFDQMMENAGRAIAQEVLARFTDMTKLRVAILVGPGNNGGDGLVAGHYLLQAGAQVGAYLFGARGEEDENLARLRSKGGLIAEADQDQRWRVLTNLVNSADILVDALLGTGTSLPLRGEIQKGLRRVGASLRKLEARPYVVAVDCPSGMDCDSGDAADETLAADLTVTLAAAKIGLLRFPGAEFVGELVIADIGIPPDQEPLSAVQLEIPTPEVLREWLPPRPRSSHKGTFGRVIVNAGSVNYPGAAVLAGRAAYRVGAGLVTMAVPASIQVLIVGTLPEATWLLLPHEMGVVAEDARGIIAEEFENTEALLVGPGFAREETTKAYLEALFGGGMPGRRHPIGFVTGETPEEKGDSEPLPACIIDADGLNLLSELEEWAMRLPKWSILTPHPGEMARLTGEEVGEIQADRVGAATRFAAQWGQVVVLKGAFTVVASPEGRTAMIPFATAALARAGTGDVLAGAIAGLRAQGVNPFEAAVLGAYLHGRAGEIAAEYAGTSAGVLAGDVDAALAEAIAEIRPGV